MNGEVVNLGLNRADITPNAFVYAGKSLQRRLGLRAGEVVECRLRPADPDEVPVPDDVATALADAGRTDAFERLRPAKRRQLLPRLGRRAFRCGTRGVGGPVGVTVVRSGA